MNQVKALKFCAVFALVLAVSGCANSRGAGGISENARRQIESTDYAIARREREERGTVWDLFGTGDDSQAPVRVNKYIWNAALDVLDFLPIQTVDAFSGVIVTGFGIPPGGRKAYRATVYVQDPALDARSLDVTLLTRSGPASDGTVRAIEDAILTRARQLRIRGG